MNKKQYRSKILASIHETAEELYEAGLLDKKTMREFDENCLTPLHILPPAFENKDLTQ